MSDRFSDSVADAMTKEPLFKCPVCCRQGFTKQGLLCHVCKVKPYGYVTTALMRDGSTKDFHFIGNEKHAKYRTILKRDVCNIIATEPITREEWIRSYGDPKLRL